MGKFISRCDFLKGAAATGVGAAALGLFHLPVAAEESSDAYTPGTYSAAEETAYSSITVTMTFSSDAITDCVIESSGDQDLLTEDKKTELAAAIVEGQGTDVDAVSSCTLVASVAAIETCVAKCIAEASGTEYEAPAAAEVTGRVEGLLRAWRLAWRGSGGSGGLCRRGYL